MTAKLGLLDWQLDAFTQHCNLIQAGEKQFFYACDVGSGKTRIALAVFAASDAAFLLVSVPKTGIRGSWTKEAEAIGLRLISVESKSEFKKAMSQKPDGIVVTEGLLKSLVKELQRLMKKQKTIFVGDEGHHLAEGKSWGNVTKGLMKYCFHYIGLSGTPDRSDDLPIVGLEYAVLEDGVQAVPTYFYSHEAAVRDGVVAPVITRLIGGSVTQTVHGVPMTFDFSDDLDDKGSSLRLRVVTACAEWQAAALDLACKQLRKYRRDGKPWAMLIACATVKQGKQIERLLIAMGEKPMLIAGEDAETESCVKLFNQDDSYTCAITITKISEGISIPRLRVGLMLTNVTTRTYFRQFRGRLVRLLSGVAQDDQCCTLFIAADPRLIQYANESRQIMLHLLNESKQTRERLQRFNIALVGTEKEKGINIGSFELRKIELSGASIGAANISERDFQRLSDVFTKAEFIKLLQASATELSALLGALNCGEEPSECFAVASAMYSDQKAPGLPLAKFYRLLVSVLISVFGSEAVRQWEEWLDRKPEGFWTPERLMESAAKFQTRTQWYKEDQPAYSAAKVRGLLDECCAHMKAKLRTHTLASLKKSAKQYKSRTEWQKADGGAYCAAIRLGILDECCKHMKPAKGKKP